MPATATKRKLSDAEKRKATLANLISDNAKQAWTEFGSGVNDVLGRGTIAGLLGAPGDIANLGENGLRALIGKPSVSAWGGQEHIGQKLQDYGLVSDVRRPKTELLASLISPAQLATGVLGAPKYASAMLRGLDNLDAPNSMRNWAQRGAIDVWHGSPHKFDEFKAMDNIGGGEGAQAYGHGGYHAQNPEVALEYMTAGRNMGFLNWDDAPTMAGKAFALGKGNKDSALKILDEQIAMTKGANKKSNLEFAKMAVQNGDIDRANLYRNQLRWPDATREATDPLSDKHFLDWDKPLSEQGVKPDVINAFKARGFEDWQIESMLNRGITGEQANTYLGGIKGSETGSQALRDAGIPGIRYLDGGSRSAGQGSHNYVTFDDALVNILERNGKPVGNLANLVAPQVEALRIAQRNASLPVEQGGLGLHPNNTPEERALAMGFDTDAYHFSRHGVDVNELDSGKFATAPFDAVGTHLGTVKAASDRFNNTVGKQDNFAGATYPTKIKVGDEFRNNGNAWDEDELTLKLRQLGGHNWSDVNGGKMTYEQMNKAARDRVFSEFDSIPYDNMVEDFGNVSYIVPPKNIRSRFAAFDPMKKDSSDLLAGLAPLWLGALIAQPREKKKKK